MMLINKRLAAFIDEVYNLLFTRIFLLSLRKQGRACSYASIWKCHILIDEVLFFVVFNGVCERFSLIRSLFLQGPQQSNN